MTDIYEILEVILTEIFEHGKDIESVLEEYPAYADELRPLLEAAVYSQEIAPTEVPDDVLRRGRTRLLHQAAQLRDAAPARRRASLFTPRFASVALGLLLVFFVSGTGLISASASSLPGDSLYPVKIGWEQAHFWFADEDKTASLEAEYEEARREEVHELLTGGRLAAVRFEGIVSHLSGSKWQVAGVSVTLSANTQVEDGIGIGSDVIVVGQTQEDGVVLADKITLSGHGHLEDHDEMPPQGVGDDQEDEPEETETPEGDDGDDDGDDDPMSTPTPEPDDEGDDSGEEDDEGEENGDGTPTPTPDGEDGGDDEDGNELTPTPTADGDEEDEDDEEEEDSH